MPAVLVLDGLHALALDRPRHDDGRAAGNLCRLPERAIDLLDVVAVDFDRVPAESACPFDVHAGVPSDHRLASLSQAVDVDDRGQVVEPVVPRVLEGFPHRAFRRLTVAAEDPHPRGQPVQILRRDPHADADRQALPERAGRHVHPGDERRRMSFEHAPERPVRQQLLVGDRPDGAENRVVERGGVALGEDQPVVRRVLRVVVVVAEMVRDEDGHQVGRRHPRSGMARLRDRRGPDRVDAELLSELAEFVRVHRGHSRRRGACSAAGGVRSRREGGDCIRPPRRPSS